MVRQCTSSYPYRFDGKCYQINGDLLNHLDASAACADSGGKLVTITNEDENTYQTKLIKEQTFTIWLGLEDSIKEGKPHLLSKIFKIPL